MNQSTVRERYPEKRLQLACVAWLQATRGYEELFGDVEATGARIDSAGFLGAKPVLIEFKATVSEPIVRHAADRSMSIESKVAAALGALYRSEADPASMALAQRWDRHATPLVVVAANSVSGSAQAALQEMLRERSAEWAFDYEVWRWSGREAEVLLAGSGNPFRESVEVPTLKGRSSRAPRRSVSQLMEMAESKGVGDLLATFVAEARTRGLQIRTSRNVVSAYRPGSVVCAAYVAASDQVAGLAIGIVKELFAEEAASVGVPSEPVGFLNTNLTAQTAEQVSTLFTLIKTG